MRTTTFLMLLIPCCSFAQSNKTTTVSNPVQIKSYFTSAGTFTIEYGNEYKPQSFEDNIKFSEETFTTSDGGSSIYILNKKEYSPEEEKIISINALNISPNPFNQFAKISIENSEIDFLNTVFIVYDLFGREVKRINVTNSEFSFEKNNLSDGMYFYQLIDNNVVVSTGKFIITNL